jgi:hypothetical protein
MADNLWTLRQPILYAEELWRRQRVWALLLPLFGVAVLLANVLSKQREIFTAYAVTLGYVPLGVLWAAGLYLNRRRNYVEVGDTGVRFSRMLRTVVVGYDIIRNVRVQQLESHFPESRRRLVRPMWKPLLERPALFIRLRGDDARLAEVRRRLGRSYVADDVIAVPIPDPDAMSWEVTSRLPERTGVNLGGQRRRKRPR